ncbi:MAG TPA: hypothetical protein VGP02_00615 [Mycobacteriales bacterium]|nr:hypothetical protein [Mycobacteriales bacterium]
MTEPLRLGAVADAGAFLARVVRLDPQALVRLRPYGDGSVALWTWLNVGVLAVRVVPGTGPADVVVSASGLLDALASEAVVPGAVVPGAVVPGVVLPPRRDAEWRGPLPGPGFRRLDVLPPDAVERLAVAGERTFKEAVAAGAGRSRSGARALTDAVLDHVAVAVTGPGDESADVPQRAVQTLVSLGFLGPDPVAVDVTAAWLRLVGTYGAVHLRRGTGLGVLAR